MGLLGEEVKLTRIIITKKRTDLYHASIAGRPELWEAGRDKYEAVGRLVLSRKIEIGMEVTEQ